MAKIEYDKYYTPPIVARWCIEKTKEIIGEENITEWVEPSAGSGSFSHQIPGCKAYDLYPQHDYIEQADFETLDLGGYKKGRCFIGNPPFGGAGLKLIKMFYDKSCDNGDYIAYIQPASFYNSYTKFKRFEIIYSCIIETPYTNRVLKTSFTIYKRNPDKNKFEDKVYDIPCIKYKDYHKSNKQKRVFPIKPDYSFVSYGDLMKPSNLYQHAGVMAVYINDEEFRNDIINVLRFLYQYNKDTDILGRICVSTPRFYKNTLNKIIRICLPELDKKYPIKDG